TREHHLQSWQDRLHSDGFRVLFSNLVLVLDDPRQLIYAYASASFMVAILLCSTLSLYPTPRQKTPFLRYRDEWRVLSLRRLGPHKGPFGLSAFPIFSTSVTIARQWTKIKVTATPGLRESEACGGDVRPVRAKARAGNSQ